MALDLRSSRSALRRAALASALGVGLLVACSGRGLDEELVTEMSHADGDDHVSRPHDAGSRFQDDAEAPDPDDHDEGATGPHGPSTALPDDEDDGGAPSACEEPSCDLPAARGFTLVLFGGKSIECPSGFKAREVVEDPVAKTGACACGACSASIDCSTGTIASFLDDGDGTCDKRGKALRANRGACDAQSGRLGEHASIAAPRAVVGKCSAQGVGKRSEVSTSERRVCVPRSSTCASAACAAEPDEVGVCLMANGDVACPLTMPTKHLVGRDFTLACGACDCSVDATCEGSMKLYARKGCKGSPVQSLDVGECTATDGESFASTRWSGSVGAVQCRKDAPPPPSLGLEGAKTICCS